MHGKVTISQLQQMKQEGRKSVGLVAWDYQIARIADRAGFDLSRSATRSASICGAVPMCSTSRWMRC